MISGSFFPEKEQLSDYYNTGFFTGWCVDEVVDSRANYWGYKYDVHFIQCHTFAVIHSVKGEGVCWIIKTTIFDVYISNHR